MAFARFASVTLAAVAALAVACSGAGAGGGSTSASSGPLGHAFDVSAAAHGVPRDVMVAIAQVEGGLTMPATRTVDIEAAVPVAGPLELRHGRFDSLARGASLMGTTELALRQDTDLAIEASARVLADVGARAGATLGDENDLASWSKTVEEMSGYFDDAHRRSYAVRVFALLARGGTFAGRDGESIVIVPHALPPHLTLAVDESIHPLNAPADYGPAEWFPTPEAGKWTAGRGAGAIDRIVIHDTEGGWDASVATLQNDAGKSVQYIVGTDGRVGQFVHEGDTAWHAGNFYYNQKSIGIEHVGYMNQPYPDAEYAASAALVNHLAAKYAIAKDRTHIVGHDQIPNGNNIAESSPPCEESPAACEASANYGGSGNHRDPGDFEWCLYMVERLGGTCKCDDIWPLWNCSSDKTEAFRCVNNAVEIAHCTGTGACESKPLGQDDVCNVAAAPPPKSDAGAPPPKSDAGSGGAIDAGGLEYPPMPGVRSDGGAGVTGDAPLPSAQEGDSNGCSVALTGGAQSAALAWPLLAILGLASARRRRHRRGGAL
jgi:hypothetical protein